MKEDLMWKTLSEKKVMDCRIFSVVMAEREAGDGRKGKHGQNIRPCRKAGKKGR